MKLGPTLKTPLVGPAGWLKSLVRLIYLNQNQKAVRTILRMGCKVIFGHIRCAGGARQPLVLSTRSGPGCAPRLESQQKVFYRRAP